MKDREAMVLTRVDLDQGGCAVPGRTHDHTTLVLYSRCRQSAGQRVSYDKRTGNIRIVCRRCEALVAEIAAALHRELVN